MTTFLFWSLSAEAPALTQHAAVTWAPSVLCSSRVMRCVLADQSLLNSIQKFPTESGGNATWGGLSRGTCTAGVSACCSLTAGSALLPCRSLFLVYDSSGTVAGVPTFRFVPSSMVFANTSVNPANAGFCVPAGNCPGTGVLNVSVCRQGTAWPRGSAAPQGPPPPL